MATQGEKLQMRQIVGAFSGRWQRFVDKDVVYHFRTSWVAVGAALVTGGFVFAAVFAPFVAPHDPYDLATVSLSNAFLPPAWHDGGSTSYLLGTDNQGRDVLSTIIFGSRTSLMVGFVSVLLAGAIGVALGLVSGYFGGLADTFIMRLTEIQLSFPPILTALLIDGILRGVLAHGAHDDAAIYIIVLAIGFSGWPMYARTVRAVTLVERRKEYVEAARLIHVPSPLIMLKHVLPNAMGPVLVIATIYLAMAIILEATLSFLGVGIPPTEPSLGTLIRVGNDYLFSGEWWITLFPGVALGSLVLAVNLLGDWLRDTFNPKLR